MVAAYLLEDSDPEASQAHARFAARIGGRIGGVREMYGILAYRYGDYRTAVRELRTSLRITGRTDILPMIADAERGMGRPERAFDIAASDDASELGVHAAIELMIVVAGAYSDIGDTETALRTLEIPALRHKVDGRWQVRLWVAYADLLDRANRHEEAKRWLTLAADADTEHLTDAAERLGRAVPTPDADPLWEDDEEVAVLDAYDPDADDGSDAGDDRAEASDADESGIDDSGAGGSGTDDFDADQSVTDDSDADADGAQAGPVEAVEAVEADEADELDGDRAEADGLDGERAELDRPESDSGSRRVLSATPNSGPEARA
ncbi:hypothetical protein ACFQRD_03050 [Brachybacterium sp. GCM10030268]|uniref:hypothetical protein n=1 Tax=Brachybacterium sp. GCM10030268 TaxID=3273382 RepID=UPI00361F0564